MTNNKTPSPADEATRMFVSLVLREKWNVERLKFFVSSPAELTPFQRKIVIKDLYTFSVIKIPMNLTVDYYPYVN